MKPYTIAKNGALAEVNSPCLKGWMTVKDLKDIQTYEDRELDRERFPNVKWVGAKFPAELMKRVLGTIHEFPNMETAFSLYYSTELREWRVKCPDQNGSGASVSYEDDGEGMPPGFNIIGSIHTHPNMGAFWSGTDLNDQRFKHGIHFVFGLREGLVDQWKCTVFMPTEQSDQELWDVVEQIELKQVYDPDKDWVETIKKQAYHRPQPVYKNPKVSKFYGGHTSITHPKVPKTHYGHREQADWDYTAAYWRNNYDVDYEADYEFVTPTWQNFLDQQKEKDKKNKYTDMLNDAMITVTGVDDLREALLEPEMRANIEHEADIVIADTSDKADCIESLMEILTSMQGMAERITQEEASQLIMAVLELNPYASLVDNSLPADQNEPGVDNICWLIEGAVDAYSLNPESLNTKSVDQLLMVFHDSYEDMLCIQSGGEPDDEEDTTTEETLQEGDV